VWRDSKSVTIPLAFDGVEVISHEQGPALPADTMNLSWLVFLARFAAFQMCDHAKMISWLHENRFNPSRTVEKRRSGSGVGSSGRAWCRRSIFRSHYAAPVQGMDFTR
jgi:hypothetical protein